MRLILLLAFVRCADAYFSYDRMNAYAYEDTNEIIVPDIMPLWVKRCFTESLYKGPIG